MLMCMIQASCTIGVSSKAAAGSYLITGSTFFAWFIERWADSSYHGRERRQWHCITIPTRTSCINDTHRSIFISQPSHALIYIPPNPPHPSKSLCINYHHFRRRQGCHTKWLRRMTNGFQWLISWIVWTWRKHTAQSGKRRLILLYMLKVNK